MQGGQVSQSGMRDHAAGGIYAEALHHFQKVAWPVIRSGHAAIEYRAATPIHDLDQPLGHAPTKKAAVAGGFRLLTGS